MRKLALLLVAFALVAVSFYGCDETTPTEPTDSDEILLKANGTRARLSSTFDSENDGWTLVGDADYSWTGDWNYSLYPQYAATGGNPGGLKTRTHDDTHFLIPYKFDNNPLNFRFYLTE